MLAVKVGTKTVLNSNQVEGRLVTLSVPRKVLGAHFNMRQLKEVTTRQYAGTVATLNHTPCKNTSRFQRKPKYPDTDHVVGQVQNGSKYSSQGKY